MARIRRYQRMTCGLEIGAMAKRELVNTMQGKHPDGRIEEFRVYKKGGSYWIVNESGHEHLIHPASKNDHRKELVIVFHVTPV